MNGGALTNLFNRWILGSCVIMTTLGSAGSLSADFDPYCGDICDCDVNPYTVYADFIYWQVHPEGTDFARYNGVSSGPATALSEQQSGRILGIGCDFCPGFRVGALIDLEFCDWDAFAQYTLLIERKTESLCTDFGSTGLVPLIFHLGGNGDVNEAKGDWHSDMNVVDFGLGKSFFVHCSYVFRPFFGLKATWQDYKYDVTYDTIVNTTDTERNRILLHSEFDGIGLRGGFDADWQFCPCISIVGGMAASALYTDYNTDRNDLNSTVVNGVDGAASKNVALKERFCALIPVLELHMGLKLTQELNDCYNAFVMVGYEAQVWFDALRFIFVENGSPANLNTYTFGSNHLTFQGLVLRAGLAY